MSAIIVSPASQAGERSRLLGASKRDTYASTATTGSTDTSGANTPSESTVFLRSAPLKDSISKTRFVLTCAGIWSANFVFAAQSTAIPTLAPAIGSVFNHAELSSYLGSVFTLANTAGESSHFIPLYGVLMEVLGRKFAMNTACLFFGVGTIGCALSPGMYWLIAARAVAGLGGGGLLTVSSVVVTDLVPLRDRGIYQGIMMTIFGAGSMLGGPVSGLLTDKYGWHWSFWVQIPIVIFCMVLVTIFLPQAPIPPTHRSLLSGLASLDWLGSILLIGSTTTLILGFSFHTSYLKPWSAPIVWGNLLASAIAAVALIHVEARVKRPLIPLGLLTDRHVAAVLASGFFLSVAAQSFTYQIPAYFTIIVNASTAQAGLILSVGSGLGLSIGSLVAGQHIRKGGAYRWLGITSVVPAVICALIATRWNPDWPRWAYWASYLPNPLGYSIFLCVNLIALVSSVDSKQMPKATALLYTSRTLGGTLGVALGGSVQLGVLSSRLNEAFDGLPDKQILIASILHSKSALQLLPPELQQPAMSAYAQSLRAVFTFSACVAVLTVVAALFIREQDLHGENGRVRSIAKSAGGVVDGEMGEGLGVAAQPRRDSA